MADSKEFTPPPVYDMTDMTGKGKNEHRRTVLIGYSVNRQVVPMLFVGIPTFALISVLLFALGPYGYLIALIITGLVLLVIFYRIKKSMDQRAYKALRDYLTADNGAIYIDGLPIVEPTLVYHQPLVLDRDPDEFRDTDVAYVTSPQRRTRRSNTWLGRTPNKPVGR